MQATPTHIYDIRPGDAIAFDGKIRTVCAKDIKSGYGQMTTVFGDSYNLGHKPVIRYPAPVWFKGKRLR